MLCCERAGGGRGGEQILEGRVSCTKARAENRGPDRVGGGLEVGGVGGSRESRGQAVTVWSGGSGIVAALSGGGSGVLSRDVAADQVVRGEGGQQVLPASVLGALPLELREGYSRQGGVPSFCGVQQHGVAR